MGSVIAKVQMDRTEWLQRLTSCCRFDPRKMFDVHGKLKPITELEENEAAAIEQHELHAELPHPDGSRKAFTVKIKFSDRLSALGLLGKACHWYADHREETGGLDGGPIQKKIVANFRQTFHVT
jgi:phage terminase small subunit